jgi:hypothetical protein
MDDLTTLGNTTGTAAANDIAAVNASSSTAIDGTPYEALVLDNIWGWQQAILEYASLTADGVTESKSASQLLEGMRRIGGYPGEIVPVFIDDDPANLDLRLLLLTGQGVLISSYPDLTAAVYVGDANNSTVEAGGGFFYKASDAAGTTPNIAGPYLILPNCRGRAPRGLDSTATIDPNGGFRYLGDYQDDGIIQHSHILKPAETGATYYIDQSEQLGTGTGYNAPASATVGGPVVYASSDGMNPAGHASESRMKNFSMHWAVRY